MVQQIFDGLLQLYKVMLPKIVDGPSPALVAHALLTAEQGVCENGMIVLNVLKYELMGW